MVEVVGMELLKGQDGEHGAAMMSAGLLSDSELTGIEPVERVQDVMAIVLPEYSNWGMEPEYEVSWVCEQEFGVDNPYK